MCRIMWTFCNGVSILICSYGLLGEMKEPKIVNSYKYITVQFMKLHVTTSVGAWTKLFMSVFILLHILVERSGGGCVMAGTQIVLAMVEPTWRCHLAPPALTPSAHWAIPPRYPTAPKLASWPLSQHWMWLFPSIQSPTIYLDPNQQRHFNYCHWKEWSVVYSWQKQKKSPQSQIDT